MGKIILHLCADIGSDSKVYADNGYEVIKIGSAIGVENYNPPRSGIYGIIANPVCREFSVFRSFGKVKAGPLKDDGLWLVRECQRVIKEANPVWWVIENPAKGKLKSYLGKPQYEYEPWWFGSPWTKRTALWGLFNIPKRTYYNWDDVPKIDGLYTRPLRSKPSLAFMHKNHVKLIPEFNYFNPKNDMEFRSLCSQKFAQAFFEANP